MKEKKGEKRSHSGRHTVDANQTRRESSIGKRAPWRKKKKSMWWNRQWCLSTAFFLLFHTMAAIVIVEIEQRAAPIIHHEQERKKQRLSNFTFLFSPFLHSFSSNGELKNERTKLCLPWRVKKKKEGKEETKEGLTPSAIENRWNNNNSNKAVNCISTPSWPL